MTAVDHTTVRARSDAATKSRIQCIDNGPDSMPLSYYALAEESSYDVPALMDENAKHRGIIDSLVKHHRETTVEQILPSGKTFFRHECIACVVQRPRFTMRAITPVLAEAPADLGVIR